MTRPIWLPIASVVMALAVWALLSGYAHASIHLINPDAVIRPEVAKEEQPRKPACVRLRTAIITLRFNDGRVLIVPMTIQERC